MAKITNKKYEEFWDKDDIIDNKKEEKSNDSKKDAINIKKEIKKEVKKEISKLKPEEEKVEKKAEEKIEKKPKPKRKPRTTKSKKVEEKQVDKVKEKVVEKVEEKPKKVEKVDKKIEKKSIIEKPKKEIVINTIKDMYMQYINDDIPYKIFFRSQLLFDSIKHGDGPILYDDHFILFGKKYIYRGIRFEKY